MENGWAYCRVPTLPDLFPVFQRLDRGESLCLEPPTSIRSDVALPDPISDKGACLGVWSSGTTGRARLVWQPWTVLRRNASVDPRWRGSVWASPFGPTSFAGVQVALQAWVAAGMVISLGLDWESSWRFMMEEGVSILSATPTFLDCLVQFEPPGFAAWQPRQITLGGEAPRLAGLARARHRFPDARFSLIFASAEYGILARSHTTDGWYPCDSLDRNAGLWRAREGTLELFRQGQWRPTGDRVEVVDRRFRVLGRSDDVANVAGAKVSLEDVAVCAEAVDGVRQAVAYAEPSSAVGQIVVLRYCLDERGNAAEIEDRLQRHLRGQLPKEAWPRRWERGNIEMNRNAKRVRPLSGV